MLGALCCFVYCVSTQLEAIMGVAGMQLWRELDERFFKLKRGVERDSAIEKNKRYIIDRINADFQKPYFGRDQNG